MLSGLSLAIIGSVICLFAQNIDTLIIGRFIQGFGGAACLPIARVIIYDLFSGATLAKIGSYMGMVFSIVPAVAPVVGGYLQSLFGWRANFVLMLILVVIATIAILLFLPETIAEKKPRAIHLKTLSATYWHIISNKQFWAYTICTSIAFSIIMLYAAVGPFLLQKTLKLTPVQYGWTSLAILVGYIIGKYINTYLIKTLGIKRMVLFGILLMLLAGLVMLVCAAWQLTNLWAVVIPIIIALIGCGTVTPNAMAGAFSTFKREIGGAVSALYGFFQVSGAFIVTATIAHVHEKTGMPLALTLTVLGIIALFFFSILTRKTKKH